MNHDDFFHIDAGNVVTWGVIVFTFIYNYGRSAQRFLENSKKINELEARWHGMEKRYETIQVDGSAGARHLFELLNAQIASHEIRITLHDSTVKDVVEIKAKVNIMMGMMSRHWHMDIEQESEK